MRTAEELAGLMAAGEVSWDPQVRQMRLRQSLVEAWGIEPGARVLEIGCGQGDMTAALADAVGPGGHVTAVDAASPDYGSPITLGDSLRHLGAGPLGGRITVHLERDVTRPGGGFAPGEFDVVVLAHCSWYFASTCQLLDLLAAVRSWAGRLCLSEWDLQPARMDQQAHSLTVLIRGLVEAFNGGSQANIRTPLSRQMLAHLVAEAGWRQVEEQTVDSSELDDARWEISDCPVVARGLLPLLPESVRPLVLTQLDLLAALTARYPCASLNSVALTARAE